MAKKRKPSGSDGLKDRVKWLLDHYYGGSRSAMAAAIQVSLTGLISVVSGSQNPGRRLIEKLVQHAGVRPAWLLTGEGQPFRGSSLPVATACLPGPPGEHGGGFVGGGVPEVAELYSPSRYWLKLGPAEPAVRAGGNQIAAGDLMLMEADRGRFPPAEQLTGRWAAVRVRRRIGPAVRLAELTYVRESDDNGPAHLEAETYEHHPLTVRRIGVDMYPDGTLKPFKSKVRLEHPKGDAPNRGRRPWARTILQDQVADEDLVALCVLLVRRFG